MGCFAQVGRNGLRHFVEGGRDGMECLPRLAEMG